MTIAETKAICKKLFALPKSTIAESPRTDYIKETFKNRSAEFCGFIGYMNIELSAIKMRRDEAVSIMADVAIAALSISRDETTDYWLHRMYGEVA